jgi:hypothetical protein
VWLCAAGHCVKHLLVLVRMVVTVVIVMHAHLHCVENVTLHVCVFAHIMGSVLLETCVINLSWYYCYMLLLLFSAISDYLGLNQVELGKKQVALLTCRWAAASSPLPLPS